MYRILFRVSDDGLLKILQKLEDDKWVDVCEVKDIPLVIEGMEEK